MNITQRRGRFIVESNDKKYTVDLAKATCDCPHFRFRLRGTDEKCKHITAAEDFVSERRQKMDKRQENRYEDILLFVRSEGPVDAVRLLERFGDDDVNFLLFRGELVEKNGVILAVN